MKNITFNEQINLFLENKTKETLSMRMQESTCARKPDLTCVWRVPET